MSCRNARQVARVRELLPWLPLAKRRRSETLDVTKPSLSNASVLKAVTRETRGAKELLAVYSEASRQPGFRHDYFTYKTLTAKLAHLKRFRAVDLLLSRMRHEGLPCGPGILLPLVQIYAGAGFPDKAVDLVLSAPAHEKVFSGLCDLLVRENRLEMARALFSDEVISGLGFPIRVRNYIGLVRAYLTREDIGAAIELLDLMAARRSVPDVFCYGSLINGLSCSGRMDSAFAVLDQMRRVGREPDVVLYNSLVCGCTRNGEMEKAVKVVKEMEDKGFGTDTGTYNPLIGGIFDHWNVADGVEVLYRMMDRGVAPDVITFTTLMSRFCRKGKVMEFDALFGKMVRMEIVPDAACYRVLFSRFCGHRNQSFNWHLL